MLASYDTETDRISLRVSCQCPTGLRDDLCNEVLGIAPEKVRVLVGDVGGGFGMKTSLYAEDVVLAFCTRELKRPLKWCAERIEEFLAATHGRDVTSKAELALDASGRILALRISSLANLGAYATSAGVVIQLMIGPWVSTSIYDIRTIDIRIRGVLTHTAPTSAYRGAGRPEAIYIIERLMDAAARKTGIDPAELRRRNMIRPGQMPYKNAMDKTYDSGQFELVMNKAIALAEWDGFAAAPPTRKAAGAARGEAWRRSSNGPCRRLRGRVTVTVGAPTRRAIDEIFNGCKGWDRDRDDVCASCGRRFRRADRKDQDRQGDPTAAPDSAAPFAFAVVGGSAVRVAAERTIDKAQQLAAEELEAAAADIEYADGVFSIAGTDRRVGLFDLARKQPSRQIVLDSTSSVAGPTWPNGCHICEVEVDPDTGAVEVAAYWSVNDVGRVVNPMIVIGQLEGGAAQGIGQALCERFVYDRESGQALTASFLDYAIPHSEMIRHFAMTMEESTPCLNNAMGVKGVGELGTIGATPAVVNAVIDALARGGAASAQGMQMPLTSERVWRALREAGAAAD